MLDIFKRDKLPKRFKIFLTARPEFICWTKQLFLAEFRRRFGAPKRSSFVAISFKLLAAIGAIFFLTSGLAAYADKKNVGPDNLLYPLKRYSEFFQLAFAKQHDLPKLHIRLAKRRAEEIRKLDGKPGFARDAMARRVKKDLRGNIEASFAAVDSKNFSIEQTPSFCRSFSDFAGEEAFEVNEIVIKHPAIAAKFRNKCGTFLFNDNRE